MCGCVAGDTMRVKSNKTNTIQYGKILSVQNKKMLGKGTGTQEFEIQLETGEIIDVEANYIGGFQVSEDNIQLQKVEQNVTV